VLNDIKLITNDKLESWLVGGPNANSREKVSMATLEAGPLLKQPLTHTITLNKIQWRYFSMIILT